MTNKSMTRKSLTSQRASSLCVCDAVEQKHEYIGQHRGMTTIRVPVPAIIASGNNC